MKLYLTSLKLDGLTNLLAKPAEETNTLFIPTATDPYEDAWFVDNDRQAFQDMGINYQEYDLKNKTPQTLEKDFQNIDLIFVSGGNSFYLLHHIYQSGFDQVIKQKLDQGTVYAGASAGAAVMGISIDPARDFDQASEAPDLKSTNGLNITPFTILPHYGNPKYKHIYDTVINKYSSANYTILTLTDQQALIIEDNHHQIIQLNNNR